MYAFDRVKNGDLDYIKRVAAYVLLEARNTGISILSAATSYNNFDCCKEILKKCPSLLYLQDDSYYKYTVLLIAINDNNYILVDYFLSVGLDAATNEANMKIREKNMLLFKSWIKLPNHKGETALIIATTYKRNLHIVKRLIEVDHEYNIGLSKIVGRGEQTALQLAVENQDHEIIKLLTDEGDPYSDYISYSIAMDLFDHVKNGDFDYVKTVRSDVLLKSRDEERRSALCIATRYNQFGCCEEILKRCPILLYHQNNTKDTVLHEASCFSNPNYRLLVDLFVGVGLDAATIDGNAEIKAENMQRFKNWINLQNNFKETALIKAVKEHNHGIVKRFLEVDRQYKLGLSEITGYDKKTPLQLAYLYSIEEGCNSRFSELNVEYHTKACKKPRNAARKVFSAKG